MKHLPALLALPTSLLSVVVAHAQELPWPQNLPRTARYYPQDEAHLKREADAQERLAWERPSGVKKMPDHEGEKFFLGYWGFGDDAGTNVPGLGVGLDAPEELERYSNASMVVDLRAAVAPHSEDTLSRFRLFGRNIFERDFQCPSGTKSCSSIGADHLCCNNDETCVSTSDGVGCCPAGATCGNDVSGCDTADGYTSCPNSPNGGCCIPGAVCKGVGCVFQGTSTVTRTLQTQTETSGLSLSTETTSGRTVTVGIATTELSVSTKTVTLTPSDYTTTQTILISGTTSTTQTCRDNYFSCPASLGGGCCPDGQACGGDGECPDISTSTSATANQPVLPTSVSANPETASTSTAPMGCPTGFYMCSAVYLGGCCRVGRNCETTSCPPQDTHTLVSSGRTIAVTGPNAEATGGSCANGWFLCGADGGGGCCPSGYQCGQVSCSATNPGQDNTLKMAPSGASVVGWAWSFLALGLVAGVGMVYL